MSKNITEEDVESYITEYYIENAIRIKEIEYLEL